MTKLPFRKQLDAAADAALGLLYPLKCASCDVSSVERRADASACGACWDASTIFDGEETLCWKCGTPAHVELSADVRERVRCRRCDADDYTAARAVGVYESTPRAALLRLKHEPHVGARPVGPLAQAQRRPPLDGATLVVPVPPTPNACASAASIRPRCSPACRPLATG